MQLIRGFHKSLELSYSKFVTDNPMGIALTIGNFDGVHLGHQSLVAELKANAGNRKTAVMIFEPQPLEFFNPNQAPARLTHFRDKVKAIKSLGVDYLICMPFNHSLAQLEASQFIEELLIKRLNVSYLLIGDDFKFGSKRQGDIHLLNNSRHDHSWKIDTLNTIQLDNKRVSSTSIRTALKADDFLLAQQLLGRPYSLSGRVIHGDKIGVQLGFPTANIAMKRQISPIQGVYAVTVSISSTRKKLQHTEFKGIANIGYRPTVKGKKHLLEVNLFDCQLNLYGEHLTVTPCYKIRNEKPFESLDALKIQINKDILQAKQFFNLS